MPFWLQPEKHYVGPAWYRREVKIADAWAGKRITLNLERCHWETSVWVDGNQIGSADSLSTPHVYDLTSQLTPGRHWLSVRVDNRVKIGVGINAAFGQFAGPSLETLVEEAPGTLHQVSLFLLGLLVLGSILRRGIRRFLGELKLSADSHSEVEVVA